MASTSKSKRSFCDKLLYDLEGGELQAPLQKAKISIDIVRIIKQNSINRDNTKTKLGFISSLLFRH